MQDRINYLIFLPVISFLFLLETSFLPQIFAGGFPPNLVMIMLFAAALLALSSDFLYVAFLFGFLFDIFSGASFGIFTAALVFSSIIVCEIKSRFIKEDRFVQIAAAASAGALSYHLIYLLLFTIPYNGNISSYGDFLWEKILFDSAYAAVLTYPAMRLISKKKQ